MDVKELDLLDFEDNMVEMVEEDEENFALSSSSAADAAFDAVIGRIEDIIMEGEFQQLQRSFMEKHYMEFEDSDENKLSYTPIFNDYVDLLEKHLEHQLMERIPSFNMTAFTHLLMQHKEEVPVDIFDMLLSFTDFLTFKEMFLDYRAEKEGKGLDLSEGLVVTSLSCTGCSRHIGSTGTS
ncbi:ADP-ribosylation factor-like protein 2-binding protein [Gadus macrocephalus]|uniref:ADP-ribosylation factor-like protein 2-binding protein n=1 Tax=Gadus macrocephalus TaxID=80720 RepID=UPI0028CB75CD|nr:ADP-ribosylation factor-like protein 2-binding protein [Gadus macrocephalus]